MSWWWDFVVDTEDWYFHFEPLARLVAGVPFARKDFERHRGVAVDAPGHDVVGHVLSGRPTLLAWLKNVDHEYSIPDRSTIEGAFFEPPVAVGGRWVGAWVDPWTGDTLAPVDFIGKPGGTPPLPVPSFSRDIALRLDYAPKN